MQENEHTLDELEEGSISREAGLLRTSTDGRASRPTDERRMFPEPPRPEDACILNRVASAIFRVANSTYERVATAGERERDRRT